MTTSGTNATFRTFIGRVHLSTIFPMSGYFICVNSALQGEWSDKCQFLKGIKRILHLAQLHCRWQRESLTTAYRESPGSFEWQLRVLQIADQFKCLFLNLYFSWQLCITCHSEWVCPLPKHLSQEFHFLTRQLHLSPSIWKALFYTPLLAPPPCLSPVSDLCQLPPYFLFFL